MKFRLLIAVVLIGLCANIPALAHESSLYLRVAHLSPTAPAVDVYVNGAVAVEGLEYKEVSAYLMLESSMVEVMIVPAGDTMEQAVTPEPIQLMLPESGYFTAAAVGSLEDGSFEVFLLPVDGEMAAPEGAAAAGDIRISGAWARATAMAEGMGGMAETTPEAGGMGSGHMAMGDVSAAYMLIENQGAQPDKLVAVESNVAGVTEIHQTIVENDVARMQPVMGGLEIPAGGSVQLMPGSYHVMFMELKQPLKPGDVIMLKMTFESGAEVMLNVPVRTP